MCGIAGAWLPGQLLTNEQFTAAVDQLQHRGPDDRGVFTEGPFYLGMRRLAIIDVAHGQQPQFDESRNGVVVFNGEIYNYLELIPGLRQRGHTITTLSDTEVIVHSMEAGEDGPVALRGMVAYAHLDRAAQKLTLVRDRVGVKPLYYYSHPEGFLFASEIKAITYMAHQLNWPLTIFEESVWHYLSLGSVPQPATIYKEIRAVPPGHSLTLKQGSIQLQSYWQYPYHDRPSWSQAAWLEQLQATITESVRIRLRSDVPVGLFLSGGIDSSVVAYEASRLQERPLQSFTVSFPDYPEVNESDIAAATARQLGMPHTVLPLQIDPLQALQEMVRVYDQPFADPSALPSLGISRLAAEHVKVVLNGDGGDEQFAGYRRYRLATQLHRLPNLGWLAGWMGKGHARRSSLGFLQRAIRITGLSAGSQYMALTTDMLQDGDKERIWRGQKGFSTSNLITGQSRKDLSPLTRIMHLDRQFNLLSGLLVKMDMASSAWSLEARSPLLDHTLFELSSRIPDNMKVHRGANKWVLKELYGDKLPEDVIYGKKRGFEIPLTAWLDNDFKPLIQDILATRQHPLFDWIDRKAAEQLMLRKTLPMVNQTYIAYALLVLAFWLEEHGSNHNTTS